MRIEGGYLLVARKMTSPDSWLMDKPPLWWKLWVWMLGQANFKDRGQLKRGQFVTSIAEMQEAMSYCVGFRKITPSRDEIRSAYQAFSKYSENPYETPTKPPMITTRKTTQGMVVTICNYKKYQEFKTYEAHKEPHDENPMKPTATPHDTELKGTKGTKEIPPDSLRLSGLLAEHILASNPNNAQLKSNKRQETIHRWAGDIDKMLRLDERSVEEAESVVRWCQADEFWQANILSGKKLREKYDQLLLQMNRGQQSQQQGGQVTPMGRRVY